MKVKECMSSNVVWVKPEWLIKDVAKLMMEEHVGCIPVCNESKKLVGLVTDRDLVLRTIACNKDPATTPVSEVMSTGIYNVTPESEVSEASKIMCDCQVRRVPVIEENQIVGIITMGDLANNREVNTNIVAGTVKGICECGDGAKHAE
ncbi:MAG: CBS domain-containing protein [Oscillospiraceae bacterium]|nr:CBS domain-containing protein [Oscillospiraceae bacterium]